MRGENNLGKDLAAIDAFYKKHPEMNTPAPTNTPTSKCECPVHKELGHDPQDTCCCGYERTPTTDSKNSSEKCPHGNPGFCGICADKELDEMEGKNRSQNTTDTGWEERFKLFDEWFALIDRLEKMSGAPADAIGTRERMKAVIRLEIQKTAKEEYERGRKDTVEFIRTHYLNSRPIEFGMRKKPTLEAVLEAALETPS